MIGLFSIYGIVHQHYSSLINDSTPAGIIILFFVIPVIIASSLVYCGIFITSQFTQVIMSVLGVLIGFSINALILLIRYPQDELNDKPSRLIDQTRDHTIYALVFGLALLVIGSSFFLAFEMKFSGKFLNVIGSWILFVGGLHYVMTLYLLPARIFALLEARTT